MADGFNNQCKECVHVSYRLRYLRKGDVIRRQNSEWYESNKAHSAYLRAERRKTKKAAEAETRKKYRLAHIKEVRARDRAITAKRRAWKRGAKSDGSTLADLIALNPNLTCYLCNKEITGNIHIDHITPLARGGNDTIDNKALTHPFCNMSKGAKLFTDLSPSQGVINTTEVNIDAENVTVER
jgi:5-methylcytosine-specific restriction endonuclease McrA